VAKAPFLAAQRGERIGIVGPNGAGKTTLLRTIAGELPPLDGMLTFGNATQLGYLAQLRRAAIPGETVIDALTSTIPVTPGEARSYLARFLFRGDDAFKEVRTLSGGERSRLELALLGIQPSNLLLLDEPTNHLDIPAREAIETFMRESPATLLVVSHDRRLLETVCDKLWVVDDGLAVAFDGGYRAWRTAVADGWTTTAEAARRASARARPSAQTTDRAAAPPRPAPVSPGDPGQAKAASPRRPRQPKLSKDAYRRQKTALDAELTRLGLRKNHLELAMGDPQSPRISSSCAVSRASSPTSRARWPSPRTPGSSSRSGRHDPQDRHHRADRLREVDRRALAWRAFGCQRDRRRPRGAPGPRAGDARGRGRLPAVRAGSSPCQRRARSGRTRPDRVQGSGERCMTSSRSSIPPSGRASWRPSSERSGQGRGPS
jgi:ABC-type multidrug transport system ATPase subunit